MNTLVLPAFDPQDIVHLSYKTQNQSTQKKLLDFLVTKNISFYQTNPKDFEAIVQIYNINGKEKSLAKSPASSSQKNLSSKLTKDKKRDIENYSPSPNNDLTSETKKAAKQPKIWSNKKKKADLENLEREKEAPKQETIKKRAISFYVPNKTKDQENVFLEELQKSIVNEENLTEKTKRGSRLLQENSKNKTENLAATKRIEGEQEIKANRLSKSNLGFPKENEKKARKSVKNDSSMKILQKNKQILDNLINSRSILEFEAGKHTSGSDHKVESEKRQSQRDPQKEMEPENQEIIKSEKITPKPKKSTKHNGSFMNSNVTKNKKSISQEKVQENYKENIENPGNNSSNNQNISEKLENNFKEIVIKEFSKVPSGEKLNKTSINLQFQKAVQILYERLDLLSSEELIFYYKFIVSKAKKLYLDFLQKRGLIVH